MPVSCLAAMLRLGTKYEIDYLRKAALEILHYEFPTTLEDWAISTESMRIDYGFSDDPIGKVLNLATELSLETVLPTAYLLIVKSSSLVCILFTTKLPIAQILMCVVQKSLLDQKSASALEYSVRVNCVLGRDKIISWLNERHISCISTVSEAAYNPACSRSFPKCSPERIKLVNQFRLWDNDHPYMIAPWDDTQTCQVCQSCRIALKKTHDGIRTDAWAKLPSFFGLPDWPDLKDRD